MADTDLIADLLDPHVLGDEEELAIAAYLKRMRTAYPKDWRQRVMEDGRRIEGQAAAWQPGATHYDAETPEGTDARGKRDKYQRIGRRLQGGLI